MTLNERLDAYERLMRLDQPIGALLLLWPALWGLWLARYGIPDLDVFLIFVVGVVLTRSAGCIINDFADRNFDPHVERTRNRPLATGLIKPAEALVVAAVLLLAAFALVVQTDRHTVMLSFIALALMLVYPFLKRFFFFPQAWLGLAFGFSIPMAYMAVYGKLVPVTWALLLANVFWAIAYDTEYAMIDREDDLKLGLKSSAILLGQNDVTGVMAFQTMFLTTMAVIGYWQFMGIVYYVGLVVAAFIVLYQYQLIEGRSREGCLKAFRSNNWVGLAIWLGMAIDLFIRMRPR